MASLNGEHKLGKHRTRKFRGCPGCFPVAQDATPVVVADEVTAVIVHPDAVNPDGQVEVKPVKRSRKVIDRAIEKAEAAPPRKVVWKRVAKVKKLGEVIETADVPVVAELPVEVPGTFRQGPVRTREAWLLEATEAMRPWFPDTGYPLGEVRVSVGWPAGRSAKKNTIGQCFQGPLVADGIPAIFISPVLTDPVEVLSTLAHELAHAAVPPSAQAHRGPFVKVSKALGLVAPWTATTAGEELKPKLVALAEELGVYTHAAVSKGGGARKVQDTRMLKVVCEEDGYTVRTTRKWLDVGLPSCPSGHEMEEA